MDTNRKYELINTELAMENKIMMENNKKQSEKIKLLEEENAKLREDLNKIIYSRSYKILQKMRKVIKRG